MVKVRLYTLHIRAFTYVSALGIGRDNLTLPPSSYGRMVALFRRPARDHYKASTTRDTHTISRIVEFTTSHT